MKIDINGAYKLGNKDIEKYVIKKLDKLEKYVPRHTRASAHAEVKLREVKDGGKKEFFCEVIVHLPHENIAAKEATMNIFAAVDIVCEKIKVQLDSYKAKSGAKHRSPFKRILHRLRPGQE